MTDTDLPANDEFGGRYSDFPRHQYILVHQGLRALSDELLTWNRKAMEAGGQPPYEEELERIQVMLSYATPLLDAALEHDDYYVDIGRVSVGSVRLWKAGLLFTAHRERLDLEAKRNEGWPTKAQESLQGRIKEIEDLAGRFKLPAAEILQEVLPDSSIDLDKEWDVFISHASEDKQEVARPLADLIKERGLTVWLDELVMKLGDSLRRSIDEGLKRSRFGVVVLSPSFFAKEWPQKELDGLNSLEVDGRKVILPIRHNLTVEELKRLSPLLADRLSVSTDEGLDRVVEEIIGVASSD